MTDRKNRSERHSKRQPEPLTVFIDNNLGNVIVREALADVEWLTVKTGIDEFPEGTKDVVWLPEVGRQGWTVITSDLRIRSHPLELNALKAACIHCFFITTRDLTGEQNGKLIRSHIEAIRRMVEKYAPPCMFSVTMSGVSPIEDRRVPAIRRAAVRRG